MRLPKEKMVFEIPYPIKNCLEHIKGCRTAPISIVQRASIGLNSAAGMTNQEIAQEVGLHYNTVAMWRQRFRTEIIPNLTIILKNNPKELEKFTNEFLSDRYRSGAPLKFGHEVRNKIKTMACQDPKDYGLDVPCWTCELLRQIAIRENIVTDIYL